MLAPAGTDDGVGGGDCPRALGVRDRVTGWLREARTWVRARVDVTVRWLTVLVLGVVAVVPIVGNELRVQDVDPMFMRNVIERTAKYGGAYYENGIYNKGSLEPIVYDIAHRITSYDGFWFAISLFVALASIVLAYAAARTAQFAGANRSVALAAAAVVYVHFTLGDSDYARVLYSRNLTVTLLAVAWTIALSDRMWSTPRNASRSAIAVGALLGFATQGLLTTVFAGAAVSLTTVAIWHDRFSVPDVERLVRRSAAAAAAAFVAPPVWYVLRGSFSEFWASWWVYARYMSVGTGRTLGAQFALGWDQFYDYYQDRPLALVAVGGLATVTWLNWHRLGHRARAVHVGVLAWWCGAWIELVLSQRYSSHYFSVLAVPTALIGAVLAGHAARAVASARPASRASLALPLVATVLAIYVTGPAVFMESVRRTSRFTSIEGWAAERARNESGADRSVRAVLDLVSGGNDPLLAWTLDPTVYLEYERVPATRFQWRSFLLGEIYLGRTSPSYVLDQTWEWFADDIAESRPVAFAETEDFTSGTPFESLVREQFREVYPGAAARVWLRADVARQVLEPNAATPWQPPPGLGAGTGWTTAPGRASFEEGSVGRADDALTVAGDSCFRLEGRVDVPAAGERVNLAFRFDDNADPTAERLFLALEAGRAGSGSAGLGATGYESLDTGVTGDGPVDFALVVGRRAAALVLSDQIVAAVRLPRSVRVTLESRTPALELTGLRVGQPPAASGCS